MANIYDVDTSAPLLLINGSRMPYSPGRDYCANPKNNYAEKSEQLVRSTRNANGQVIAQKINRRLNKFDNLTWPILSREQVTWLKQQIAGFECRLSYWDSEVDGWVTRRYYWGDFEATPFEWETVHSSGGAIKRPKYYKDVKCNLIDCGY